MTNKSIMKAIIKINTVITSSYVIVVCHSKKPILRYGVDYLYVP